MWYNLSNKAVGVLDVAYDNVYRHVYNAKFGVASCKVPISTEYMYSKFPFPNVLARIRARRSKQFARVLTHAPAVLVHLLAPNVSFPNSLGAQIVLDLQWQPVFL